MLCYAAVAMLWRSLMIRQPTWTPNETGSQLLVLMSNGWSTAGELAMQEYRSLGIAILPTQGMSSAGEGTIPKAL